MFTITFILDNRIDTLRCPNEEILQYNIDALKTLKAKILLIKNQNGEAINR